MKFQMDSLPACTYTGSLPFAPGSQHAGAARKKTNSGRAAS